MNIYNDINVHWQHRKLPYTKNHNLEGINAFFSSLQKTSRTLLEQRTLIYKIKIVYSIRYCYNNIWCVQASPYQFQPRRVNSWLHI